MAFARRTLSGVAAVAAVVAACARHPANQPAAAVVAGDESIEADKVLDQLRECEEISHGRYRMRAGSSSDVPICRAHGAIFWRADMDIDCDGLESATCNLSRDPDFQPQTSAVDSNGRFLDAATVPYVVIPQPSARFDFRSVGISLGSVVLVIYQGAMEFAVFADEGPADIIGEGSVGLATRLGIDADPARGGVVDGVTYVVFPGQTGVVTKLEDHGEAVSVGRARLAQWLSGH